jgi:hypothetical protein
MTALRPSGWIVLLLSLMPFTGSAQSNQVPAVRFQGVWNVDRHFFRGLREGESNFEDLGEESEKGAIAPTVEIRFKLHESGAVQRYWTDRSGKTVESKGITIIESTPNEVIFKPWSDHLTWKTILKLKDDGTAVLQVRSLKHQETFFLSRGKNESASQPEGREK